MVGRTFLGQYETVRPLGEGNMGKVYLARRKSDGGPVVVKVMHDHLASDPKFRELFEREMQFMARLKHPNIIELLDASVRDPQGLCIVMEYADGIDVEHLLKKNRRFPVERVGRWLGQLSGALAAAHAHGVIHRDLKPANMMLVDPGTVQERIKVMDFGLAKLSGSVHISLDKLKGEGGTIATGTAEYMAPEQVRGDELDHRGDIYSVGIILFELLTGRLPFGGSSIHALLQAHAEDPPPKFAEVGAAGVVSPAIEAVVQRCLLKFAVERYQNAWELGQAFEKALGEKIMEGAPPPPPQKAPPPPAAKKKPVDPNAVVHELEAWMPERIAVVKLKGFVDDMHGEVVESVGGKIRVLFGQPNCKYQMPGAPKPAGKSSSGLGGWFGLGGSAPKVKSKLIEMELQMDKKEDPRGSVLHVTVLLRAESGPMPRSPDWFELCNQIYKDLRAYFITK
jgi:serine/threonine protein kinase